MASVGKYQDIDWYDTPLYYDIVYDVDTEAEAQFLSDVAERFCQSRGKDVLEPACGTGRLLAALAKKGFRVSGFDRSEAMLEFARLKMVQEKVKEAGLELGDMESFEMPGRFDLVFCLLSTFKYLTTEDEARRCLQRVYQHLKPGGGFVLGVHLVDYASKRPEHERWVGKRDGIRVVSNTRTWPPDNATRLEKIRNRLEVENDGGVHRQESVWNCRTYDAEELSELISTVEGWKVVACYDFFHDIEAPREFDDSQNDLVVVLRKAKGRK